MPLRLLYTLCLVLLTMTVSSGDGQERRSEDEARTARQRVRPGVLQRAPERWQVDSQVRRPRGQVRESGQSAHGDALQRKQSLRQLRPDSAVRDPGKIAAAAEQKRIFENVQEGMRAENIGMFSQHFGSQVLCNLRGGGSGYYSANQAYYLLENYFRARKLVAFDLSTIGESDANPYATGSVTFNAKGAREIAQVYISLSLAGDRWVISQVNIY